MKKLVTSYTFTASTKTVVASAFTSLEQIQLITNVASNVVIYNFADPAKGGSLSGTTLTLDYNTASMSDADKLQIFIDDAATILTVSGTVTANLGTLNGAATSAKQDTGNTSLASIDTNVATRLSESDFDTKIGALTETAPASDTASSGLNGRLQRVAQRLTSVIGLLPTSLGQKTKANSLAVTLASDQDALPITDNAGSLTVDGTITANAGIGTFTNQQSNKTGDFDSGAGTDTVTMFGVALPKSGGAAAGGTTTDPLRIDPTGTTNQPVSGTVTANAGTGTFNIQSNASVNQTQINGTTIDTNSGTKSAGTQRVVIATDQPALTNALKVDGSATTQPVSEADGANTTLGSKADAKSAATDTTAVTVMQVLKQISASVQAPPSQAVTNVGTFAVQSTLQAGSAIVGKFTTDQTIHGTTDLVAADVTKIGGTAVDANSGNKSAGTQRIVIATDQPQLTNVLKVDGSAVTQPVSGTGSFTVAQPTAANLKAQTSQLASVSSSATLQSAASATGNGSTLNVDGMSSVTFTVSGTFTATVTFEGSEDGSNFASLSSLQLGTNSVGQTATAPGIFQAECGGLTLVRARVTWTSGTSVTVTAHAVPVSFAGRSVNATIVSNTATNQSMNLAQVGGTATDTNSGSKSAGTQRIVIATDQPQLTNALKVDGSAVTQPVSGTVTSNIGTTNGLALDATLTGGSQQARITDGTTTASVQAIGTGQNAVTTAGAFKEVSGTASALNADVIASLDVSQYKWVSIHVIGTFNASYTFQGSNDNSNWINVTMSDC